MAVMAVVRLPGLADADGRSCTAPIVTHVQPPVAMLSPADYVNPTRYEFEVAQILATSWLPVCRADQLRTPGDRFAVTLAGRPLVAVRDPGGEIRVLANVCTHRGSTLVEDGSGHGATLVCPYHRWAYRLDGSLIGAPLAEGADLSGACLPAVRHTVWEGFVLVDLSGSAADPDTALAQLSAQLSPWQWGQLVTVASQTFTSSWNWKVMVENWIECYHHIGAHRDSVEPFQPARTTKIVPSAGEPWAAMTVEGIDGIEGEPKEWIPGLSARDARLLSVWSAFPLLLGGSVSRYGFWLQIVPVGPTNHTVTWHLLVHPDHLTAFTPEVVAETMGMFAAVHREDMEICERVQRGLASGLVGSLRLVPLEATIAAFQRWVHDRLNAVSQ